MIEKKIRIDVETGDAEKDVKDLNQSIENVGEVAEESSKKATKSIDGISEANKGVGKSSKIASVGVKAIGSALKAIGIGLIIALVVKFTEVLTSNKKISDALSTAFETINLVLGQVVGGIVNAVEAANKATGGFDALGKVLKGLFTLAITPLKGGFFAIKLALQEAQLAWEKSFFGDDDPETIKKLNEGIKETKENIIEVGKDALKAGFDIKNNFSEAITEVADLGNATINELSKVSLSAAFEQAKVNTQLKNSAELAEARLQGLIEKYDRQAELLRQIRDDDQKSIAERIQANEELGRVLDEQAQKQKEQARIRIAAAQANVISQQNSIESQRELIEATNELAAIEAQVEGFRSEQLVNRNALEKERIEILRELNEIGKNDLELAKAEAEQIRDDRLAQIELQVEDEKEKFRLLAEARLAFDERIAEIDQAEKERLDKLKQESIKRAKEEADKLKQIKDAELQQRVDAVNQLESIAKSAEAISGKQTAATKALAVASTLVSTYQGAQQAYTSQIIPGDPTSVVRGVIAAAAAVASGLANVKQILSVKVAGQAGGSGGNSVGGGAQQQQPAFNLVGRSNVNQLQTGLEEQETAPVKAFVVSTDVTNQQEADRATQAQASFG